MPPAISRAAEVRASSTMSDRPVWTVSSTRRCRPLTRTAPDSPRSRDLLARARRRLCRRGCMSHCRRRPLTPAPPRLLDGRRPPAAARRRAAATGRTPRCQPGRAAGSPPPRRSPSRATRRHVATSSTASARCPRSRTTPPAPSRSRPTSNCGLTIGSRSASSPRAAGEGGQHEAQRDEGQVGDDQVDRAADRLRRQRAHVGALVHAGPARRCAGTRRTRRTRRRRRRPRRRRGSAAPR